MDKMELFNKAVKDVSPWVGVELPENHSINETGVYFKGDKRICGPCWVEAFIRNNNSDNWGLVVQWIDRDNKLHKAAILRARFHELGNTLMQELANGGLEIVPGCERNVRNYLAGFSSTKRQQSVDKSGWVDTENNSLLFVLPHLVIPEVKSNEVIFQPEKYSPTTSTMKTKGTLKEWQTRVALLCSGHPFLIFSLCAGLAGSLLKHAHLDSGGFNFYGRSSHGKTTLVQVAASEWGCGADPADAPDLALIRKWNATANAFEGLAAAHNDLILILDELATCPVKDFGSVAYNLFGGQGKNAMDVNRNLKKQRSWRILVLSTGEISSKQKIEEVT